MRHLLSFSKAHLIIWSCVCLVTINAEELYLQARVSKPRDTTLSGHIGGPCVQAFENWNVSQQRKVTHEELLVPFSAFAAGSNLSGTRQLEIGDTLPLGDNVIHAWLSQFGHVRFDRLLKCLN